MADSQPASLARMSLRKKNPGARLKHSVKELLFSATGPPVRASELKTLGKVLDAFTKYEMTREGSASMPPASDGKVFEKLSHNLGERFGDDFPFYLILAHQVQQKRQIYQFGEVDKFVETCVKEFDLLDEAVIAKTLKWFTTQDNKEPMYVNNVIDPFSLLEKAFIEGVEKLFVKDADGNARLAHENIGRGMRWILCAMKCHLSRSDTPKHWETFMWALKEDTTFSIDVGSVCAIGRGMGFGQTLELPGEQCFTSGLVKSLVEADHTPRSFAEMRKIAEVLCPYVDSVVFTSMCLRHPRACCEAVLQKGGGLRTRLSPTSSAVVQGLDCLEAIAAMYTERGWKDEGLRAELKDWLLLLIRLVDDTSEIDDLEVLLARKHSLSQCFYDYIEKEVIVQKKLSVKNVFSVYDITRSPYEFLEEYLLQYGDVCVGDPVWSHFFAEAVRKYPGLQDNKLLLGFLRSASENYQRRGEAKKFVLDLLHLDIGKIFVKQSKTPATPLRENTPATPLRAIREKTPKGGDDTFQSFLQVFVKENMLQEILFQETNSILDSIVDNNDFQYLVLELLQREAILAATNLKGTAKPIVKSLMEPLYLDENAPRNPSAKFKFCWDTITAFCKEIPITDDLSWAKDFYGICENLGWIYGNCCDTMGLKEDDQRLMLEGTDIPHQVDDLPNSGSVRVLYAWIQSAQRVLHKWNVGLKDRTLTREDVLCYKKWFNLIRRVVVGVSANKLLITNNELKEYTEAHTAVSEKLASYMICQVPDHPEIRWCSLPDLFLRYDRKLPHDLLDAIARQVTFPAENMSFEVLKEHDLLKTSAKLCDLESLLTHLEAALSPVLAHIPKLLFFSRFPSKIVTTCLKFRMSQKQHQQQQDTHAAEIGHFATAFDATVRLLAELVKGGLTYARIGEAGLTDLGSVDFDSEFEILDRYIQCVNPALVGAEGLKGIKCMLQLFLLPNHVNTIKGVCEQYQLTGCTSDPTFKELVSLATELSEVTHRHNLSPLSSLEKMDRVMEVLCLRGKISWRFMDLFSAVAESQAFYKFIVEDKEFVGEAGRNRFEQQYGLINTYLQHEEYNELVCNHLKEAFLYISPFTDKKQDFHTLMMEVGNLGTSDGYKQLQTVNRNIHLIKRWFSRLEKNQPPDVISAEFEYVLSTGCFEFTSTASCPIIVILRFKNSSGTMSVWNDHEIRKFVRDLQLSDPMEDSKDRVDHFLCLHETVQKILKMHQELRSLSHPDYLQQIDKQVLQCTCKPKEAEEKLAGVAHSLLEWKKEEAELHKSFPQLLFFSRAKLVRLSQMLNDGQVEMLAQEISFLFQPRGGPLNKDSAERNTTKSMKELEEQVKILLKRSQREQNEGASVRTPLHTLGFVVSELMPKYGLRSRPRALYNPPQSVLYVCTGCTQSQLISLIVSIYRGAPEVYEILHCQPSTSKKELERFISPSRHALHKKTPSTYLLLEVNLLPSDLQEMLLQAEKPRQVSNTDQLTSIGFIATGPSLLDNMIAFTKFYNANSSANIDEVNCLHAISQDSILKIELVYGNAGDGKSSYIEGQLKMCPHTLCVIINEAFTISGAIEALNKQTLDDSHCGIWFNFTLLPPGESVDEVERKTYQELMNTIGWFFFRLFIIGYVEDPVSGKSFSLPRGLSLEIYVEVPSLNDYSDSESLEMFQNQMPTLKILGKEHKVPSSIPYAVDNEVQLVCRYLNALKTKKVAKKDTTLVDFKCHTLLEAYIPENMKSNKFLQKLFIKYMTHRCKFLDSCEDSLRDKPDLKAVLLKTMLSEISGFCDTEKPYHQLVYDVQNKTADFILMTLHPDQLSSEDVDQFKKVGIRILSVIELCQRELLDKILAHAIGLPLNENGRLTVIDESSYVLTSDFVVKMLNIHERARCKVPVVIEGETGVGKTALIEMMSKLWNLAALQRWSKEREELLKLIRDKLQDLESPSLEAPDGKELVITEEQLLQIGNQSDPSASNGYFFSKMRNKISQMKSVLCLLEPTGEESNDCFSQSDHLENTPKATARLAYTIFHARMRKTFHKLNVHSGLKPANIKEFFEKIFKQVKDMQSFHISKEAKDTSDSEYNVPFVTVFLDEVNTSSCLGLLKEIIVDRTLEGVPIPENVFVISACNPHHGDSSSGKDTWIRGTYYVRQLHPTLRCLTWDYGALGEKQEGDYFKAKLQLSNKAMEGCDLADFTSLVMRSQKLVRGYALEQLRQYYVESEASVRSRSCVSQRDIQRVFVLYEWLMRLYRECRPWGDNYSSRAILITLALVYYIRLDAKYRERYQKELDQGSVLAGGLSFIKTFNEELEWLVQQVDFPTGIPKTQALKENLFTMVACTMTHTPLIIVGAPGTSNISFDIALANLRGLQSKRGLFQRTDIFKCLEQQFYQCSHHTTSDEITKVFSRAMSRQNSHASVPLPIYCVVFMNEAGFPEEKLESLKVLHYYLDGWETSFVAISNHVLDAAKTNRAVSLYQPETSKEDLVALTTEALDLPSLQHKDPMAVVNGFCLAYQKVMEDSKLKAMFGIQDFIHFVKNLHYHHGDEFSPDVVIKCLEENFNGVEPDVFNKICTYFLRAVNSSLKEVHCRSIAKILQGTLQPRSCCGCAPQDIRYKMFIDPSEDGSLAQMLLSCNVLKRQETRIYMCSDFPGDTELQKIQNIKAIQQSMALGHTVVLNQTDAINDSFYDVFSRRFEYIDKGGTPRRYYANIVVGSHIRLCQVHPSFECILVVKKSELDKLPTAFLGLFDKYHLSHSSILEAVRLPLPDHMKQAIQAARKEVEEFVAKLNTSHSIFSVQENTLDSVLFSVLPPVSHTYNDTFKLPPKSPDMDTHTYFITLLLDVLCNNGGFRIPEWSSEDIACNTEGLLADIDWKNASILNDDGKKIAEMVRSGAHAIWSGHQLEKNSTLAEVISIIKSVFQHWLVQYMRNRLLQLVIPEAIFKLRAELPISTVQYYFDHQHHFSLKSLIDHHGDASQAQVRKLLCFTRSSDHLIHQLPSLYPSKSRVSSPGTEDQLRELVSDTLEGLVVHRVSPQSSSFSLLNDDLASFCRLDSLHTMLLVVKHQEVLTSVVTHLRVMINEAENQVKKGVRKLFVVLIQYPQMQSSSGSSHLSLFSSGWDLYYLDTIGRSARTSVADVTEWLKLCCSNDITPTPCNSFARIQDGGVPQEAFMKASSKLSFNNKSDKPAIIEKVLSKGVRETLITQFASYWDKSTAEDLFREILHSHSDDVAIGMHDCAQAKLRDLFFNFVYYMALQMNEGDNLELLIHDHHHPDMGRLFIELLKVYPVPTLKELKALHGCIPSRNEGAAMSHKFPFFVFVSSKVEEVVDCCRRQLNQQQYCLNGSAAVALGNKPLSLLHTLDTEEATPMRDMVDLVSRKLEEVIEGSTILGTVIEALITNSELWVRYFEDYIHHRIHVDFDCKNVAMVASLERTQQLPIGQRLARLHVYFSVHRLNLPQVASTLGPLDNLIAKDTVGQGGSLVSSWDKEGEADSTLGLGSFVVDALFDALLRVVNGDVGNVIKWLKVYHNVLLFPALKQSMYKAQGNTATKFNLIHMVYLMLGSSSPDQPDIVQIQSTMSTFQRLNEQYSKSLIIPELKDMATATLNDVPGDQEGRRSRLILEGLLNHYFAEERSLFADRDCEWFMDMANKQQHWLKSQESPHPQSQDQQSQESPHHQFSLSVFKFHLQRLMRHHSIQKQDHNEALFHHQATKIHQMVIRTLAKVTGVGPDHYIPAFYTIKCLKPCKASENSLMQQPLAHLYFVTVFERLLESGFELPALVRVAQQIRKKCEASSTSVNDRILLYIEEQATVQAVIQKLAKDFNLNDSEAQYNVLSSMLEDVNKVLDDDRTGGGEVGGHGLALVMCMLAKLGSFGALRELLVNKYSLLCEHINCLRPFNRILSEKTTQDQGRCALIGELGADFEQLYTRVSSVLCQVHKSNASKKTKDLTTLMQKSSSAFVTIQAPFEGTCPVKGRSCVQMAAWLCIFQEFWAKNIPSPNLSALLSAQKEHLGDGAVRYMERFLEILSAPPKKDSPKSHCYDPIMALFNPSAGTKAQGLQRALLYLVTMAVGSHSKHWYKMLANHLMDWCTSDSALPCTTEQQATGPAASVKPSFEISMSSSLSPTRKPQNYSYPSHKFIQWVGFASCCLWLLINPSSGETPIRTWAERSSGGAVSCAQSIQQYCALKLRGVWDDMLGKLSISVEELVFLVQCFLFKLFTVENMDNKRFSEYWEKLLQERLFDQLCSTLKDDFRKKYPMLQCSLLESISQLNTLYPWFPNEKTLSNTLDIRSTSITDSFHFLSKFINGYEQLQITGQILPGFLELYLWLHTERTHTLSLEEAKCLTIGNIVKEVSRTCSFNREEDTLEKIIVAYNRYLYLRKGVDVTKREHNELLKDASQPLIDFLSVEEGNDLLYKVIVNMVELHNGFIKTTLNYPGGQSDRHPYILPSVPLSEFNHSHCIVRSSSDNNSLLEMIRRRSHLSSPPSLPHTTPSILSNLPGQLDTLIDLAALQDDIIALCIVGKPLLVVSNLRVPFKFREAPSPEDSNSEQ